MTPPADLVPAVWTVHVQTTPEQWDRGLGEWLALRGHHGYSGPLLTDGSFYSPTLKISDPALYAEFVLVWL